jgi:diguanylate cyclase (GGDEF)-like protein
VIEFDIPTGVLMTAMSIFAATVALVIARQLHMPVRGVGWWCWGSALMAFGGLVIAFRPPVPPAALVLLGTPMVVVGMTINWGGIRLFVGRPVDWRWLALPPVLAILGVGWFAVVQPSLNARMAVTSVMTGVVAALIAADLLQPRGGAAIGVARRFTGLLFAVHAVSLFGRSWAIGTMEQIDPYLLPVRMYAFIAIWAMFFAVVGSMGFVLMVSERLLDDLARQASHDPLTGVLNRRAFAAAAARRLAQPRPEVRGVAMLMMDIDHFKRINDSHGHAAGDAVLTGFTGVVSGCIGERDLLCRLGGEEFAVLLTEATPGAATATADRIRSAFAAHAEPFGDVVLSNTVSIGVAEADAAEQTIDSLLRRADTALYAAKREGRNRVVHAQSALSLAQPLPEG